MGWYDAGVVLKMTSYSDHEMVWNSFMQHLPKSLSYIELCLVYLVVAVMESSFLLLL